MSEVCSACGAMARRRRSALLLAVVALAAGCETIKPYEKEFLLDPVMSDERALGLSPSMMSAASSRFEKLSGGLGGAAATSCPTCGG